MSKNILQDIINKKKRRLIELKKKRPLESLLEHPSDSMGYYNFKETIEKNIQKNKISIIAEIKKASPSAGIIIKDYNPLKIAEIYNSHKATCLSVLTEEDFFYGDLMHISKIKQKINLPILCKDFFVDPFQVHLAKSYGADAILIIIAGVNDELADQLYEEALKLNMSVIVEVHTVEEAKKALRFNKALIGINNRNLDTLKIDLNTTKEILEDVEKTKLVISESGISSPDDIRFLHKCGADAYLVGSSIMQTDEIQQTVQKLVNAI